MNPIQQIIEELIAAHKAGEVYVRITVLREHRKVEIPVHEDDLELILNQYT